MAPNGPLEIFFPANPDLADFFGRTDVDFETFNLFDFLDSKFLDFQDPRLQNLGPGWAWAGPGRA